MTRRPRVRYRPPNSHRPQVLSAAALIILLLLGSAVALFWSMNVRSHQAQLDANSLCDAKGPSAVTVILIDATDPIGPIQRQKINDGIARVVARLQANERVEIFEIRPDKDLLRPDFSKCRPASEAETSEWTGNKRQAKERFDREFGSVLQQVLDRSLTQNSSETSPIMEAIQAAAEKAFGAPDLRADVPHFTKQLIIVSDMMQNSQAGGSHYENVPSFTEFETSPVFREFSSDLRDVHVQVFYLWKKDAIRIQGLRHGEFWREWLMSQGVTNPDIVSM